MSDTIYLYLKTHNVTGLKYLGKTESSDPFKYQGSGKYWKRHIAKHGYDVTTEILFETTDKEELKRVGLEYSEKWHIVESKEFANLKCESGDGGAPSEEIRKQISNTLKGNIPWNKGKKGLFSHPEESKEKMRDNNAGENNPFYGKTHSDETKAKMSKDRKGKNTGKDNGMYGKTHSDEQREKWSCERKGNKHTEEAKKKIADAQRGDRNHNYGKPMNENLKKILKEKNRIRVTCPHCGKEGTNSIMKRWHFDRCKHKE